MNFRLKNILKKGSILIVLLTVFVFLMSYLNREIPDTRSVDTHVIMTTDEMISLLDSETPEPLKNYIEKAIQIKGTIKEVNYRNGKYTLLLCGQENGKFILCEMQDDQAKKVFELREGAPVVIKGILKGALLDLILLNCIFIDE